MENTSKVITVNDVEYKVDDLDNNQRYLLVQIQEVSNDIQSLNMKVDQLQAALTVFKNSLAKSLEESSDTSNDNT
tara:strand:- start:22 stop:246 length:225 start_codon:yes stop_codon:yes gene_type:complete